MLLISILPQVVRVKPRVGADDDFRKIRSVKLLLLLVCVGRPQDSKAEQLFEDEESGENCADCCECILHAAQALKVATFDPCLHCNLVNLHLWLVKTQIWFVQIVQPTVGVHVDIAMDWQDSYSILGWVLAHVYF